MVKYIVIFNLLLIFNNCLIFSIIYTCYYWLEVNMFNIIFSDDCFMIQHIKKVIYYFLY
jgi:hypothetical protein